MRPAASLLLVLAACQPQADSAPAAAANVPAATGMASIQDTTSEKNVVQVAVASPDHTTLVAAVQAAGLVDVLASSGPYTVFAPTNAAFDKLPAGTVETLLKPENLAQLQAVLRHHVTTSIWALSEFKDGMTMSMADGTPVTFSKRGEDTYIGDAKVLGKAKASNGVVYVIDAVVVPAK
ncbi:MAG TPA: fasciclin domain-containing protein [Gemmatimonadales bacterium]